MYSAHLCMPFHRQPVHIRCCIDTQTNRVCWHIHVHTLRSPPNIRRCLNRTKKIQKQPLLKLDLSEYYAGEGGCIFWRINRWVVICFRSCHVLVFQDSKMGLIDKLVIIPSHVLLSSPSAYPVLHWHSNDPGMFMHRWLQPLSPEHSSTSETISLTLNFDTKLGKFLILLRCWTFVHQK